MITLHSIDVPKTHFVKYYDVALQDDYMKIIRPWNTTVRALYKELKYNPKNKALRKILWEMYTLRSYTIVMLDFEELDSIYRNRDLPSDEKIKKICEPYSLGNSSGN